MVGCGTRLSPDLFGPGEDMKFFYIFDFYGNLKFFAVDVPNTVGSLTRSLSARLFDARVALAAQIDSTARATLNYLSLIQHEQLHKNAATAA